jgi:hypothetical protein
VLLLLVLLLWFVVREEVDSLIVVLRFSFLSSSLRAAGPDGFEGPGFNGCGMSCCGWFVVGWPLGVVGG